MFKNLRLRNKILLPVMLLLILGFSILAGYTLINLQKLSFKQATDLAEETAQKSSLAVRLQIEEALTAARSVALIYQGAMLEADKIDRDLLDSEIRQVVNTSKNFFNFYTVIEPNELDGKDKLLQTRKNQFAPNGQYRINWYRDGNTIKGKMAGGVKLGDWYQIPMKTGKECVTDAYYEGNFNAWMTSVTSPIFKNGKQVGVCGIDLLLETLDEISNSIKLYQTGFGSIIDNSGTILGHKNKDFIGKKLNEISSYSEIDELEKAIRNGQSYQFRITDKTGKTYLNIFKPLYFGQADNPWSIGIVIPIDEISTASNILIQNIVFICITIFIFMIAAIFIITHIITAPIEQITNFAEKIANGDLQTRIDIDQKNEIGRLHNSLQRMIANLIQSINSSKEKAQEAEKASEEAKKATKIAQNAQAEAVNSKKQGMLEAAAQLEGIVARIISVSKQLTLQIEDSSKNSEIQKDRITETATAMEEMNVTVLEVAKNAVNADSSSNSAKDKALEGENIVLQSIHSITEVKSTTGVLKEKMEKLGIHAEDIGTILNVISDIADQTNLLALNAAIEAARAGEYGRGFAVVADEVRKLAEKTMNATKEVESAIKAIQTGTTEAINSMTQATTALSASSDLAEASGKSLKEIVSLVETSSDQVRSIATASEEQSAASEEINQAIISINKVSCTTAETMEKSQEVVNELGILIQEMQDMIKNLQSN